MRARKSMTTLLATGLLLCLALPSFAQPAPQPYRYAEPAQWVNVMRDLDLDGGQPVEEGHSDYLLVDNQVRLSAVTSHYFRTVERLTSQDAVDRAAQRSISIDPEHELALLHDVRVIRQGRSIDKLADARRSLLNREEDLENGRLNGRVTLHLLLQDVRVGDILDFSYTLERRDPFGERGYNDWFSTQWGEPVRQVRLRMLSPPDRPLVIKDHGKLGEPVRRQAGALQEIQWRAQDVAALTDEDARPKWHLHYPRIEISEFRNWDAVRAWMKPLYRVDKRDDPGFRELLADVKAQPNDKARLLRALRFVQDDIRYTGIEIGAGAYRPTQPAEVISRRYGDCKDKTLLLITLLREVGIEAWPALVHSSMGRAVVERAPGPGAFDHVIAKVRLGNKDYWFDATASGQGGDVDTAVQADFGPTLVIDDTNLGLQLIPPRKPARPTHQVTETYDLRQGRDKTATFTVKTVFREDEADAMRARMRSKTVTAVSKEYLDYYRKTYSGIRMAKPVTLQDNRAANEFTLTESYEIDHPFEKDDGEWKFPLEAYLVSDRARKPELVQRTTPLARAHPVNVHHEIVAYLPTPWNIEPDEVKISDPAFEYRSDLTYRDGELRIVYDLRSASDHVPASRLAEYSKQIARVHDDAYFTLTDSDGKAVARSAAGNAGSGSGSGSGTSMPASASAKPLLTGASFAIVMSALGGLVAGFLAARSLSRCRVRTRPVDEDAPTGIDGWLLVPGSLTVLLPLVAIYLLVIRFGELGNHSAFEELVRLEQHITAAQIALLCALAVMAGFGSWLLLERSRNWTVLFTGLMAVMLSLVGLEFLHTWRTGLDPVTGVEPLIVPTFIAIVGITLLAYVARSHRVRATFTKDAVIPGAERRAGLTPATRDA
jgi:transglutaminase-like putative cysteine protease